MKKKFRSKSKEEIKYYKQVEEGISSDVTSDDITYAIDEISIAASQFGFNFDEDLKELKQLAKELEEAEMEKRSIDYSDFDDNQKTTYTEKDIESLFDSLNEELL